jgi:hypothetical protein
MEPNDRHAAGEHPRREGTGGTDKQMTPEQVAPLVSYLLGDQAHQISGQVFVVRGNEVMLMSQPRPIRTMALSDGWTIESLASHFAPAIESSLVPLETSPQVFSYDPV